MTFIRRPPKTRSARIHRALVPSLLAWIVAGCGDDDPVAFVTAELKVALAAAYAQQRDREMGRAAVNDGLRAPPGSSQHPPYAGFVSSLGNAAMAKGDLVGAEARYLAFVKLHPDSTFGLDNIASVRPESPPLRTNLAKLYLKTGDKAQATSELLGLPKLCDKFAGQTEVGELLKSL